MSSAIELLREGIEQGNWPAVCTAYHLLTGSHVAPPAGDGPRAGQTLHEIRRLLDHLSDGPAEQPATADQNPPSSQKPIGTRNLPPVPDSVDPTDPPEEDLAEVSDGAMRFISQSSANPREKAANEALTHRAPPRARRPAHRPIIIPCGECGQSFEAAVAPPRDSNMRCPKCLKHLRGN